MLSQAYGILSRVIPYTPYSKDGAFNLIIKARTNAKTALELIGKLEKIASQYGDVDSVIDAGIDLAEQQFELDIRVGAASGQEVSDSTLLGIIAQAGNVGLADQFYAAIRGKGLTVPIAIQLYNQCSKSISSYEKNKGRLARAVGNSTMLMQYQSELGAMLRKLYDEEKEVFGKNPKFAELLPKGRLRDKYISHKRK